MPILLYLKRDWKGFQGGLGMVAALLLLSPSISFAKVHPWLNLVAEICVPLGVSQALSLALIDEESNRNPFAIGMSLNGKETGFLPSDLDKAQQRLEWALKQTTNVGIGLLQINYHHHRTAMLTGPHHFFDAKVNLSYGCKYMATLLRQPGPLWQRIGRYYAASNPAQQEEYAQRVLERMMRYLRPNGGS